MSNRINLVKENTIISEDQQVADTLNDFFKSAVLKLGIYQNIGFVQTVEDIQDPIEAAIHKFEQHPSIIKIKEVVGDKIIERFNFSNIDVKEMEQEVLNINVKKATTFKNIPPKILKKNADICAPYLQGMVNSIFETGVFPDKLKLADVKKIDTTEEKNYRPVSVLPTVSKIIERIMQRQLGGHMNKYLSDYLYGYRKGYSAQHDLVALIEKWKSSLEKTGYGGRWLWTYRKHSTV